MAFLLSLVLLSSWTAVAFTFPHNTFDNIVKGSRVEFESSGSGPDEPVQGTVKVVQLDPRALAQSGFFRRGLTPRRVSSISSRLSFPAFLSRGRPGLSPAPKTLKSPLHHLQPKSSTEMELKKRQGLQMWQRAINKGEKLTTSLQVKLRDTKQACAAVPFTQRVTADGCETITLHNKLCFGQCSSLFVPSEGEFAGLDIGTDALNHRTPCSRCAPSKSRVVTVPLRCGADVREKQVMVVEECKCETSHEENRAEAAAPTHL
uniref:DAN domain family member 5 n=1 Tax=Scatophagus argus TaxID=75038 RepID=UPI001ED81E59|nr:DAN domain family member 5 [Scatophagus argus]